MKILYLHQYFNTPAMKGGTRSYEMAKRMVKRGHEVHMITSRREHDSVSSGWSFEVIDGIHVHWLHVPYHNTMSYKERIKAFFIFALKAGKKAIQVGGDLIFATSTPLTIAIPAVKAKKKLKIPLVFEVRDLWPELPIAIGAIKSPISIWLAKRLERFAYFNSEHVVALSPGMKEGVTRTGFPADRVSVIPNSCDLDSFGLASTGADDFRNSFSWLQDRPLVLYAGTLGHINGVAYLANVASEMVKLNSNVRFLVIGTGVDEAKVRDTAKRLGVYNDNFFMLERVSKAEVASVFNAATISTSLFIDLPEMWANSANKFFDSLAAGKPVAINYEGWQAEIVRERNIGKVLPPQDFQKAAEILNEMISDEHGLANYAQSSRNLAESDFSRDKLASRLIAVVEEVAKEHCN